MNMHIVYIQKRTLSPLGPAGPGGPMSPYDNWGRWYHDTINEETRGKEEYERNEEEGGEEQMEVEREVQGIHLPLLHLHQEGLSVLADQVYPTWEGLV